MTEDEAKVKWCPFVRFRLTGTESAVNRDAPQRDEGPVFGCIGSACMAWRRKPFNGTPDKIAAIKEHRRVHGSDLLTAKNAVEATWSDGKPDGFCGLAGSPQ